jgi:hypothetical protein
MKISFVLCAVTFACSLARGQLPPQQAGGSAKGSLRVTAVVESSVWLVTGPDGKQEAVVANAPDPTGTFYREPAKKANNKLPDRPRKSVTPRLGPIMHVIPRGQQIDSQSEVAVLYDLATPSKQFEVRSETVMKNVNGSGKTERRAVNLITIVVR